MWDTVIFKWVGFSFSGEDKFINDESLEKALKQKSHHFWALFSSSVTKQLSRVLKKFFLCLRNIAWRSKLLSLSYRRLQLFLQENNEGRGKAPAAGPVRPCCFSSCNRKSINYMFRQRFELNALLIIADCTHIQWPALPSPSLFLISILLWFVPLARSGHKHTPKCNTWSSGARENWPFYLQKT